MSVDEKIKNHMHCGSCGCVIPYDTKVFDPMVGDMVVWHQTYMCEKCKEEWWENSVWG